MARPRTPTALKLIKGTDQPCRINKKEPKPVRAIPSPPDYLSDRAKTTWGAVAVLLDRMGVLTEADGLALEGLCEAHAELVAARAALAARGGTTYESRTEGGAIIFRPYPEVTQIADADRRFRGWLSSVGMTPADRSRISVVGGADKKDPWADL